MVDSACASLIMRPIHYGDDKVVPVDSTFMDPTLTRSLIRVRILCSPMRRNPQAAFLRPDMSWPLLKNCCFVTATLFRFTFTH